MFQCRVLAATGKVGFKFVVQRIINRHGHAFYARITVPDMGIDDFQFLLRISGMVERFKMILMG